MVEELTESPSLAYFASIGPVPFSASRPDRSRSRLSRIRERNGLDAPASMGLAYREAAKRREMRQRSRRCGQHLPDRSLTADAHRRRLLCGRPAAGTARRARHLPDRGQAATSRRRGHLRQENRGREMIIPCRGQFRRPSALFCDAWFRPTPAGRCPASGPRRRQNHRPSHPRSTGRGPIEASDAENRRVATPVHPRSTGRGPIEACLCLTISVPFLHHPRSTGRGPIEAKTRIPATCVPRRHPRSTGRGPIEAIGSSFADRFAPSIRVQPDAAPLKPPPDHPVSAPSPLARATALRRPAGPSLQWGRVRLNADGLPKSTYLAAWYRLQWGRVRLNADGFQRGMDQYHETWLQWGRVRLNADGSSYFCKR
jgi:hypothetical protein